MNISHILAIRSHSLNEKNAHDNVSVSSANVCSHAVRPKVGSSSNHRKSERRIPLDVRENVGVGTAAG